MYLIPFGHGPIVFVAQRFQYSRERNRDDLQRFGANLFPYSHCLDHWSRARTQMEERLYRLRRLNLMDQPSEIWTRDSRPSRFSREVFPGQIVTEEPGTPTQSIEKRDSPLEDETGEDRAPSESSTPGTDNTSLEIKMQNLDPYSHSQPEPTDRGSMLRPGICPYRTRQDNGQASTSQIIPSQNIAQEADLQPARSEPTAQGSSSNAGRWKGKGRQIGRYANGFVPSGLPIQEEESEPAQPGPSGHASSSHAGSSKGKQRHIEWDHQHHANEDAPSECVMREADFQVAQPGSSACASSSRPSGSKGKQRQIDSRPPTTGCTHFEYLMRATGSTTFPGLCEPAENQSAEIKEAVRTVSSLRPAPEDLPRYVTLDSLNLDPRLRSGCIEHSMAMSVRIESHVCPELEPCWSPACSKSVPPCRFADSYFEYGKMPCHWGMGKLLRDHAQTFGEDEAMEEDPADIMRAYRWRHQKDQRHQGDESWSNFSNRLSSKNRKMINISRSCSRNGNNSSSSSRIIHTRISKTGSNSDSLSFSNNNNNITSSKTAHTPTSKIADNGQIINNNSKIADNGQVINNSKTADNNNSSSRVSNRVSSKVSSRISSRISSVG
ncbi:hypothetical protein JADG_007781 [Aureobasidium aubasidani]|nr:hypothetical protein JADG_007781 [Aureobasidium pullulans]